MRATLRLSSPAWLAQPKMTSSISSAGTLVALDERGDDEAGEIVGAHAGERAAKAADGRAQRVDDDGVRHAERRYSMMRPRSRAGRLRRARPSMRDAAALGRRRPRARRRSGCRRPSTTASGSSRPPTRQERAQLFPVALFVVHVDRDGQAHRCTAKRSGGAPSSSSSGNVESTTRVRPMAPAETPTTSAPSAWRAADRLVEPGGAQPLGEQAHVAAGEVDRSRRPAIIRRASASRADRRCALPHRGAVAFREQRLGRALEPARRVAVGGANPGHRGRAGASANARSCIWSPGEPSAIRMAGPMGAY